MMADSSSNSNGNNTAGAVSMNNSTTTTFQYQLSAETQQPAGTPPPPTSSMPGTITHSQFQAMLQQQHQQQQQMNPNLNLDAIKEEIKIEPYDDIASTQQQSYGSPHPSLVSVKYEDTPIKIEDTPSSSSTQMQVVDTPSSSSTLNIKFDKFDVVSQEDGALKSEDGVPLKPVIRLQAPTIVGEKRNVVGRLSYMDEFLYMTESSRIDIGRNSSTSAVNFHVGKNTFISRKHFRIIHNANNNDFYVVVLSKNGIFIEETFNRRNLEFEQLPNVCHFRFPSTDIRLLFESFADLDITKKNEMRFFSKKMVKNGGGPGDGISLVTPEAAAGIYSPLNIKIPKLEKKSPPMSPTGTISAANSCPTSPRQSFRDYHTTYSGSTGVAPAGASSSAAASSTSSGYNNSSSNGFASSSAVGNGTVASGSIASSSAADLPAPAAYNGHEYEKPLYSYAQLIVQSISASPEKQLTLSGIYTFITRNYPYYRKEANKGWQNSIRHNLSLNRYFLKVERSQDEPGKGSFWRIDPNSEGKLIDQSYRKRRQRGSQCFRAPYGLPRSAPASPSHMDHSQDNSPLHDVVLQSAPGSPDRYQQQQPSQSSTGHHQPQAPLAPPQPQQQQQQPHQNGGSVVGGVGFGPLQTWPE